jgi:tRNA (guanine-N(7)-)-methyltransferase
MPVRSHDVFADVVASFHNDCNAFVAKFVEAQANGSLPVAMGSALRDFPGQWREKIAALDEGRTNRSLIVEIGCHTGHTICDMAQKHPECLFVGVDITFKRVVQTAQRAKDMGLKNIFAVLANAKGLQHLFKPEEVSGFVTFFPDPWKKKKHAHNRLYSAAFCETTWKQLSPGGFLWLKTDQHSYFSNACDLAQQVGFLEAASIPIFHDSDFSSFFMRRFELQRQPWYGRKWVKFQS